VARARDFMVAEAAAMAAVYGIVAAVGADGGDGVATAAAVVIQKYWESPQLLSACDRLYFSCGLYYRNGTFSSMAFQRVRVIVEALSVT
jgi:hypothetical protein